MLEVHFRFVSNMRALSEAKMKYSNTTNTMQPFYMYYNTALNVLGDEWLLTL